jgi:hypothetical protein
MAADVPAEITAFIAAGVDAKRAAAIYKKKAHRNALMVLIEAAGEALTGDTGEVLATLATGVKATAVRFLPLLASYVADRRIANKPQASAALRFLNALKGEDTELVVPAFERSCGVGVVVEDAEIVAALKVSITDSSFLVVRPSPNAPSPLPSLKSVPPFYLHPWLSFRLHWKLGETSLWKFATLQALQQQSCFGWCRLMSGCGGGM